jgi:hypothetical protein
MKMKFIELCIQQLLALSYEALSSKQKQSKSNYKTHVEKQQDFGLKALPENSIVLQCKGHSDV